MTVRSSDVQFKYFSRDVAARSRCDVYRTVNATTPRAANVDGDEREEARCLVKAGLLLDRCLSAA